MGNDSRMKNMKSPRKKLFDAWPFHVIIISIYPVLALYAFNVRQVQANVIIRPLIVFLLLGLLLLFIIRLLLRDWQKAGVETFFILFLLFTYGHLYNFLKGVQIGDVFLGRHRYLMVFYGLVLILGSWLIIRKNDYSAFTRWLNVFSSILLIIPITQVMAFSVQSVSVSDPGKKLFENEIPLTVKEDVTPPDIYYIILDTYTRGDALLNDFNYDESGFIQALSDLGFYVAGCSRSNYGYTQASLVSSLNMNYMPALSSLLNDAGLDSNDVFSLIKHSQVRQQLEEAGFRTVALQTGYAWSEITDADVYISLNSGGLGSTYITKFESMLLRDTAGLIIFDSQIQLLSSRVTNDINFPFTGHVVLENYKLGELQKMADIQGPKFVFAHILMPHVPIVFSPDGEILTDPGYYAGDKETPINDDYLMRGYSGEVQYLNSRLLEIVTALIKDSTVKPIIILQGDHGLKGDNHFEIFNAYYLPDGGISNLYASITPVNSFRVVFSTYFGTQYPLLEDQSIDLDGSIIPETSPTCLSQ